jgi:hypothetical protein
MKALRRRYRVDLRQTRPALIGGALGAMGELLPRQMVLLMIADLTTAIAGSG